MAASHHLQFGLHRAGGLDRLQDGDHVARADTEGVQAVDQFAQRDTAGQDAEATVGRSEEHTSELQSLMRISYAVFCLKKKKTKDTNQTHHNASVTNINMRENEAH